MTAEEEGIASTDRLSEAAVSFGPLVPQMGLEPTLTKSPKAGLFLG